MAMMPKRTKYRKVHRGKLKGFATRGQRVSFGDFGLQALDYAWITGRQIEAGQHADAADIGNDVEVAQCPHGIEEVFAHVGGALEQVCQAHGVEMIRGPHCYAFFEGVDTFTARDEIDAFYLTDFLARQFDAFVWKPLGLDRHPELRDMYFGHYTKLVYQAQTEDPALTAKAHACAERLGLAFERRFTGYGDLATVLAAR